MAKITLIAIVPTNSPGGPGKVAIGRKAIAVVNVEPSNGTAKCLIPATMEAERLFPASMRQRTSSTITIALSINKPKATIKPVTDI